MDALVKYILQNKWLLLASFCSALTISFIKQYSKTYDIRLLFGAGLSEIGLIYGYIQLLKYGELISQFALVKIIAILIVIIPSILVFNSVITIKKIMGICFALISIYLLN